MHNRHKLGHHPSARDSQALRDGSPAAAARAEERRGRSAVAPGVIVR
eukprot:COSAG06_NODE_3968_length_4710_cov_2.617870_3_plen_47_part_00